MARKRHQRKSPCQVARSTASRAASRARSKEAQLRRAIRKTHAACKLKGLGKGRRRPKSIGQALSMSGKKRGWF